MTRNHAIVTPRPPGLLRGGRKSDLECFKQQKSTIEGAQSDTSKDTHSLYFKSIHIPPPAFAGLHGIVALDLFKIKIPFP